MSAPRFFMALSLVWVLASSNAAEQRSGYYYGRPVDGPLVADFVNPPQAASPWIEFEAPNAYMSIQHLPADFQAMAKMGFGGIMHIQLIASSKGSPVADRIMSTNWMDQIRVCMRQAKILGVDYAMNMAEGCGTGGHWITEQYAAKKLVYSEAMVDGPAKEVSLPPAVGPNWVAWDAAWRAYAKPTFYRDVAVIAIKEAPGTPMRPDAILTSSNFEGPARETFLPPSYTSDRDPNSFWQSLQPKKKELERQKQERVAAARTAAVAAAAARKGTLASNQKETSKVTPVEENLEAVKPELAPETDRDWVQHSYLHPIAAVGAVVVGGPEGGPWECELLSSNEEMNSSPFPFFGDRPREPVLPSAEDKKNFKPICSFTLNKVERKELQLPETEAKHFRLLMTYKAGQDAQLAELCLLRKDEKVNLRPGNKWWMFKSGNYAFSTLDHAHNRKPEKGTLALDEEYPQDNVPADVKSEDVIDLTDKVTADGKLAWAVPPGRWTILRFGYNTEGALARSVAPSVTPKTTEIAFEADVLNTKVAEYTFDYCAKPIIKAALEEMGKPPAYLHIDSWELGASGARGQQPTWTDDFAEKFKIKRGYDLRKFLPVMARRVVDSRESSMQFMWDYRRTMADLYADFYERLQQLAEANGTTINAQTPHGTYPFPHIDGLQAGGRVGVPKGEFWCYPWERRELGENYHNADLCDYLRNGISAARAYGHRIACQESLICTRGAVNMAPLDSPFATKSKKLPGRGDGFKTFVDDAFSKGLNEFCQFGFAHTWGKPLENMEGWGISRYITWLDQAYAFQLYMARCQSLLRRGWPVVDTAYFTGEGSASFVVAREYLRPTLAEGYEYDGINTEVILTRARVKAGRVELPGDPKGSWKNGAGCSYAAIVFPEDLQTMSPVLCEKLKSLIEEGATVICPKPQHVPGLSAVSGNAARLQKVADTMWGADPVAEKGEKRIGKGLLAWGRMPGEILQAGSVPFDLELRNYAKGAKMRWGHRRDGATDLYFMMNHCDEEREFTAVFRVADQQPEFFDPVTGETRVLPEFTPESGGRTAVAMRLAPYQSGFVVFRNRIQKSEVGSQKGKKNFPVAQPMLEIEGPWQVSFDAKWGGPKEPVTFEKLVDWTTRSEEGIKYYGGTGIYRKNFDVPNLPAAGRLYLDVGEMRSLGDVRLNGKDLGVIWCYPMRITVPAGLLKPKANELEIRVVTPWNNRVFGDGQLPKEKWVLSREGSVPIFFPPEDKGAKLMPAGLMGPVKFMSEN